MSRAPAIVINIWRDNDPKKPWLSSIMVDGDEEAMQRYEDIDDAFIGASRAYDAAEDRQNDGAHCSACNGSGEGLGSDTVCMECHGMGVRK